MGWDLANRHFAEWHGGWNGSSYALDQPTGCNGTAYTYDSQGDGHILTASSNGAVATYQYAPFGRRFSKTVNGTTVYYLFDEARRGHGRAIGHTPAAAIALPQAGMYGLHCTQMPIIYKPLVLLSVPSAPPESQSQ